MGWMSPLFLPLAVTLAAPAVPRVQDPSGGTATDAAQATPVTPPPVTATIALTPLEERMTVPVQVAGRGPYRFIVDTGSERTVIAREVASLLGLRQGRVVRVTSMSGTETVGTVLVPSVKLSDIPDIGEIEAPALERSHLGAHGLLGIDTLQNHRVEIDFDRDTMAVMPSSKRNRRRASSGDEVVVTARSLFGQLIVTDAEFDGRPVRVVIDTGSPVSVANEAFRRMASRASSGFEPLEMTSATGGTVQTRYARVDKLRLGKVQFNGTPIAFADVAPFARFGLEKKPAILLGMSALRNFRRVDIDFPNREIRFRLPRNADYAQVVAKGWGPA